MEPGAEPLGIAAQEGDGLRAVGGFDLVELTGADRHGLFPRDRLKLTLATLTHTLHGRFEAVFTVDVLAVGCTFGAEDAVIAGEAVGALDFNDLAVLDVGINAALRAGGTDIADSVANFDPCFFTGDLCFYESLQFSHGRHLRSIQ